MTLIPSLLSLEDIVPYSPMQLPGSSNRTSVAWCSLLTFRATGADKRRPEQLRNPLSTAAILPTLAAKTGYTLRTIRQKSSECWILTILTQGSIDIFSPVHISVSLPGCYAISIIEIDSVRRLFVLVACVVGCICRNLGHRRLDREKCTSHWLLPVLLFC